MQHAHRFAHRLRPVTCVRCPPKLTRTNTGRFASRGVVHSVTRGGAIQHRFLSKRRFKDNGVRAATPLSTKPSSRSVPDRSANAEVSLIRLCLVPTASCTFYLLPSSCRPPPRTLSPRRSFKFRPSISLFLLSSDDLTQEGLTCPASQLRWSSSVAPGPRGLTLSPSSNNDSPFSDFACITTLG
jgi:hypothetical protein